MGKRTRTKRVHGQRGPYPNSDSAFDSTPRPAGLPSGPSQISSASQPLRPGALAAHPSLPPRPPPARAPDSRFIPSAAYLAKVAAGGDTRRGVGIGPASAPPSGPLPLSKAVESSSTSSSSSSDTSTDTDSDDDDSDHDTGDAILVAQPGQAPALRGQFDFDPVEISAPAPTAPTPVPVPTKTKKRTAEPLPASPIPAAASAGTSLLRAFAAGGTAGAVNAFKRRELDAPPASTQPPLAGAGAATPNAQPAARERATYERKDTPTSATGTPAPATEPVQQGKRAKPPKAPGALPLTQAEKDARLPHKLLAAFPDQFTTLEEASDPRLRAPEPALATAAAKLLPAPNDHALHGFWPAPPPLPPTKKSYPPTDPSAASAAARPRVDIFVDNSNVLYTFLNWVRQRPDANVSEYSRAGEGGRVRVTRAVTVGGRKARLDYGVLFGVVERGRRVGRRCLVGSSPVWQDLSVALDWVSNWRHFTPLRC